MANLLMQQHNFDEIAGESNNRTRNKVTDGGNALLKEHDFDAIANISGDVSKPVSNKVPSIRKEHDFDAIAKNVQSQEKAQYRAEGEPTNEFDAFTDNIVSQIKQKYPDNEKAHRLANDEQEILDKNAAYFMAGQETEMPPDVRHNYNWARWALHTATGTATPEEKEWAGSEIKAGRKPPDFVLREYPEIKDMFEPSKPVDVQKQTAPSESTQGEVITEAQTEDSIGTPSRDKKISLDIDKGEKKKYREKYKNMLENQKQAIDRKYPEGDLPDNAQRYYNWNQYITKKLSNEESKELEDKIINDVRETKDVPFYIKRDFPRLTAQLFESAEVETMGTPIRRGVANVGKMGVDALSFLDVTGASAMPPQGVVFPTKETKQQAEKASSRPVSKTFYNKSQEVKKWMDDTDFVKKIRPPTGGLAKSPDSPLGYLNPKRAYMTVAENAPQMLVQMGVTAINPAAGAALMAASEGGSTYTTMREFEEDTGETLSDAQLTMLPAGVGAFNAALEQVGLGQIMKSAPASVKGRLFKTVLDAGSEGITEGVQEFNQIAAETAYKEEIPEESFDRIVQATYAGMLLGGGLGSIGNALPNATENNIQEARQIAQEGRERITIEQPNLPPLSRTETQPEAQPTTQPEAAQPSIQDTAQEKRQAEGMEDMTQADRMGEIDIEPEEGAFVDGQEDIEAMEQAATEPAEELKIPPAPEIDKGIVLEELDNIQENALDVMRRDVEPKVMDVDEGVGAFIETQQDIDEVTVDETIALEESEVPSDYWWARWAKKKMKSRSDKEADAWVNNAIRNGLTPPEEILRLAPEIYKNSKNTEKNNYKSEVLRVLGADAIMRSGTELREDRMARKRDIEQQRLEQDTRVDKEVQRLVKSIPEKGNNHIIRKTEKGWIKNKIKAIRKGADLGARDARDQLQDLKKVVVDYAKRSQRGIETRFMTRSEIKKVLTGVQNAKDVDTVQEAFTRINNLRESAIRRQLKNRVNKWVERAKTRKDQGGRQVGRIAPEAADIMSKVETYMAMSNQQAQEIQATIHEQAANRSDGELTDAEQRELFYAGNFADVENMTLRQLANLEDNLKAIVQTGRSLKAMRDETRAIRNKMLRENLIESITAGQGVLTEAQEKGVDPVSGVMEALNAADNYNSTLEYMLDKMTAGTTKESFGERTSEFIMDRIQQASNAEGRGLAKISEMISDNYRRIFGIKNKLSLYKTDKVSKLLTEREDFGLEIVRVLEDGTEEVTPLPLTQGEGYKLWQLWQDETLHESLEKQGITESTINQIWDWLDPRVREWAEWELYEFYPMYYQRVNEAYRKRYDANLPYNPRYTPIQRRSTKEIQDDMMKSGQNPVSSVANSHLISRVKSNNEIKINDGLEVLQNHVSQMEHFIAWANPMRDIRSILSNSDTQNAIRQYHGNPMRVNVNHAVDNIARGGVDPLLVTHWLDKMRKGFVLSKLAMKPALAIKQLTSHAAYWTYVPTQDYVKHSFGFFTNDKGMPSLTALRDHINTLKTSDWFRNRMSSGYERDVALTLRKMPTKTYSGTISFEDMMMMFTRAGDAGAILSGGWSVYKYNYDKAIRQGKNAEAAHKIGIKEFEKVSQRTQQSSDPQNLNWFQTKGSLWKLFTMFTTSQSSYFRMESQAIRNIVTGRGSFKQNAKQLFVAHVVLPQFFQFVANGFRWDNEDQLRALTFGSFNGMIIVGDMLVNAVHFLQKGWSFKDGIPLANDIYDAFFASAALFQDAYEDFEDVKAEDVIDAIKGLADFAAITGMGSPVTMAGVLAGRGIDIAENARQFLQGDRDVRLLAGYTPYMLGKTRKQVYDEIKDYYNNLPNNVKRGIERGANERVRSARFMNYMKENNEGLFKKYNTFNKVNKDEVIKKENVTTAAITEDKKRR